MESWSTTIAPRSARRTWSARSTRSNRADRWAALGLALLAALGATNGVASEAGEGLRAPSCELTPLEPSGTSADAPTASPASFVRAFEGRVTLIDFWASWCPTCEHAFGYLNALARDYHAAGLDVIAVNLDANPRDALDFLAHRRVDFELARDATGRCPRGFGLVGMPQAFLVDEAGRVRAVMRGFRASEARELRDRIEALLEGAPAGLPAVAAGPESARPAALVERRDDTELETGHAAAR